MIVLPVITREMREQARAPFTYGLRVLAAIAMLIVCVLFAVNDSVSSAESGARLFGYLNCTLFGTIWFLTPLICGDCISREKREGTLGLLFLTPLTAPAIVLAKGLVHGLRALMLWLAVIPVLALPVMLGAVGGGDIAASVLINFSALCLVLAAGLIASSLCKVWLRAQLLAFVLAAFFAGGLLWLIGYNSLQAIFPGRVVQFFRDQANVTDRLLELGAFTVMHPLASGTDFFGVVYGPAGVNPIATAQAALMRGECQIALLAAVILFAAIRLAAWNVRRRWREEPPSAFRRKIARTFCTPVLAVGFFRGWMRRKLERNPIGWLGQRTWTGRLVTWGWFAAMISLFTLAISEQNLGPSLGGITAILSWLLIGSIAASAAGSFRRERESGMMELLLVSPMTEGQITFGRLRGLWGQFLPAVITLMVGWTYLAAPGAYPGYFNGYAGVWQQAAFPGSSTAEYFGADIFPLLGSSLAALPVIGLFYSLRRKNFIGAFLATVWMGLAIPAALKFFLYLVATIYWNQAAMWFNDTQIHYGHHPFAYVFMLMTGSVWFIPAAQLLIAWWTGRRLHQTLVRRNFAFTKMTAG